MDSIGTIHLDHAIKVRGEHTADLPVKRRVNLGDMVEMELRGWMVEGNPAPRCTFQTTEYMVRQITGLTESEYRLIDSREFGNLVRQLAPFVGDLVDSTPAGGSDSPGTGEA